MNWRIVSRLLGVLFIGTAIPMVLPVVWAIACAEWMSLRSFALTIALMTGLGGALMRLGGAHAGAIYRREALLVVAVAWFVVPAFGALPFLLDGVMTSPFDAYFESVSGFTTTGASVLSLSDITISQATSMWRMETHWLGGMGIMVLFVAVLPSLGVGGKMLFKNEVPGPITEGVKPRIRETSVALWRIYIALTLVQTLALMLCGTDLHFALGHSFATLGTGGFSTLNASIGELQSAPVEWVVILFMFLGGANFSLYFYVMRGDRSALWKDPEFRTYLWVVLAIALTVAITILPRHNGDVHDAARHGLFQVVSLITTTGFASEDFNTYPAFARNLLFFTLFIGACTGSTAGGPKIFRFMVLFRVVQQQIQKTLRPQAVSIVKMGHQRLGDDTVVGILTFFFLYLVTFLVGAVILSTMTPTLEVALSATIACLGNVGPGLAEVGPMANFGWIAWPGKLTLSVIMILGRLELYTVLVLFAPSFWRR
jgi:trk system potassium uptake protein TrkH